MTQMLLICSTVALVLLMIHSWRTRGRFVTLAFFTSAALFGVIRGNGIWLLCQYLSESVSGDFQPYIPQESILPPIGHESLQVAVGWVFALYLAWTVSELILRRLPRLSGRVFMIAGLASLFMCAICWCMETTAVAVGWWYWTLSTKTTLFGNVNVPAMEGWFSVVPDFLIPFLVIVCSATGRKWLKWLWVLAFPLHLLGHLTSRWSAHAYLVYNAMELLVVLLMMFSPLRMARGEIREKEGDRLSGMLLAAALAIFFGVIVAANATGGDVSLALTALPMLMLCLLAWRRLPALWVAALSLASLAGWTCLGPTVLWVLVPAGAFGFLWLLGRTGAPFWLRLAPPLGVVALTAVSAWILMVDRARTDQYVAAWLEGDRMFLAGKQEEADAAYRRADGLRPRYTQNLFTVIRNMTARASRDPRQAVMIFEHRLPRIIAEIEEMARRDPGWVPLRRDLVNFYVIQNRISDATEQYRELSRLRPKDPDILAMLGYFLLREGKVTQAEEACAEAMRLRTPPVEAMINLGVIRFSRGGDEEAKPLWEQARAREPKQPIALLNLERLKETPRRREIDLRYLARIPVGLTGAVWVNAVAAGRESDADQIRLFEESAQFDATYPTPHVNVVRVYLLPGPLEDKERALWHARRALALAGESGSSEAQAEGLLALGRALIANGRLEEARRALEDGKAKAPDRMLDEFIRLLDTLK